MKKRSIEQENINPQGLPMLKVFKVHVISPISNIWNFLSKVMSEKKFFFFLNITIVKQLFVDSIFWTFFKVKCALIQTQIFSQECPSKCQHKMKICSLRVTTQNIRVSFRYCTNFFLMSYNFLVKTFFISTDFGFYRL